MKISLPYWLPFLIFGLFTYAGELLPISPAILYPIKTLVTGVALYLLRDAYKDEIKVKVDITTILAGTIVFLVWIGLDPYYPKVSPQGFNPHDHVHNNWVYLLIGIRLCGAVLVVPLMEELFWRSFAMRFLISSKFKDVPLGTYTRFSFMIVCLAFGLEHHHWLAGIMAGAVYGWLLVRSRNLFSPILAHGVTNLLLGIYVLAAKAWVFW